MNQEIKEKKENKPQVELDDVKKLELSEAKVIEEVKKEEYEAKNRVISGNANISDLL